MYIVPNRNFPRIRFQFVGLIPVQVSGAAVSFVHAHEHAYFLFRSVSGDDIVEADLKKTSQKKIPFNLIHEFKQELSRFIAKRLMRKV
jgi:hypothetical protein